MIRALDAHCHADLLVRHVPSFSDRLIINSDGAKALSQPFMDFLTRKELLDAECRRAVLRDNALRFFGLNAG